MRALFSQQSRTKGLDILSELQGEPVTPNDSTDLVDGPTAAIYVAGAGNVNVNLAGGGTALFTGLSAGQILPVCVSRILATNTTATGIQALYHAGNL